MNYSAFLSEIIPPSILNWADLIWFPLAFFAVHKSQRVIVAGFLVASMVMMRLLAELVSSIGYPFGLLGFWDLHVFLRGLIVYSIFYGLYLLLAFFSPGSFRVVLLAASISIFFITALAAVIVMVL